ncbi:efflux RND transporter periplasmic adaptor subunit [Bacillus marasmi]|uniref:efflux RND transporter periplasmic adaptor subunit n=1 Tax=Bacillus marasmi TaxID=1926279 RepID=UPI0011C787FE|nr:efflux RND transporter periplasmic adaptor subunit [Bacillus marasmi]
MKKWIISTALVIILVGGGVAVYQVFLNKEGATTTATAQTQTVAAELGDVEVAVSGTGNISAINKQTISSTGNGTVDVVNVAVGDSVTEGQELITFEDDRLEPIVAPFSGEITALNVTADDSVQMGTELIVVTDYSNLQMIVNVDELDIAKVQVGQAAKIEVSALLDKEFTGTVTSVAKEANSDASSSVAKYEVKITINEPTEMKVGMTAEATITIEKKENVLTVPVAAIQKQDDMYYVLIPTEEQTVVAEEQTQESASNSSTQTIQTKQQNVEIGLQNDTSVEIVSGIAEGEEVVLPSLNSNSSNNQRDGKMMQSGFPGANMMQGGMPPSDRNTGRNQGGFGQ